MDLFDNSMGMPHQPANSLHMSTDSFEEDMTRLNLLLFILESFGLWIEHFFCYGVHDIASF